MTARNLSPSVWRKVQPVVNGRRLASADVYNIICKRMSFTATASVEEVATALGLRPVAVRQRIKAGTLSAVRIGRSWRVNSDSVNALLGQPPAVEQPKPPPPPPLAESVLLIPLPPYTLDEREAVTRYEAQLNHPDPDRRAAAERELWRLKKVVLDREFELRTNYGIPRPAAAPSRYEPLI